MSNQINNQLMEKFFEVSKKMHQQACSHSDIFQLTIREMIVLKMVRKKQTITIQDIARHLKITMPTTSVLLNKLEKNNFIQRVQNPKDKRSTFIKLSPKAQKITDKLIKDRNQKIKLFLSFLPDKDKKNLIEIFDNLLLKLNSSK